MRFLRVFDSLKIVRTMFVAIACVFMSCTAHAATLPAGYTELEYLESTGTQYINTGYMPTVQNVKYVYSVQNTSTDTTTERHPARIASGRIQIYHTFSWRIYETTPNISSWTIPNLNIMDKVDFVVENNYDNSLTIRANNRNVTGNFTTRSNTYTSPITLFAYSSVSSNKFIGRIYYFRVYENGVVRFNAVPVRRDSDGVLGMYDLADSNPETAFHTNAGTGNFIAGEYKIKIATTKYNEAEFAPVQTNLNAARTTINNLITQMQTNAINVSKLAVEKQTRPNADCPAGKNCLLVMDPTGAENWYEIAGADAVQSSSNVPDYFSFTTTALNAGNSISFDLTPSGTFTVDWGDGSAPQVIERTNTTSETYSHSYSNAGEKTIKITGRANGYSTAQNTGVLRFGNTSQIASIDGCLGAIFPTLGNASGQQPKFYATFINSSITSIPAGLFSGVTGAAPKMFSGTFYGTQITSIPENLFSGVNGAAEGMFESTFQQTQITSIPENLFRSVNGAADGMFSGTFMETQITSIPENLFRSVNGAADGMFGGTFMETPITSIPENLFRGVTGAAEYMFRLTFSDCPNLTGYIPESTFAGLIQNNSPDASYFMLNIFGSTGLATTCPQNTTEVSTPYKSAYWSTGNGNAVMCRPNN